MSLPRLAAALFTALLLPLLAVAPAHAYPDADVTIDLNGSILVGGTAVTFSADSGGVECDWSAEYLGQTSTGAGTTFSGTFTTPAVDERTTTTLTVTCTYEEILGLGSSSEVQPAAVASASATVTLLPEGGVAGENTDLDDDGVSGVAANLLPDTGGQSLWILIGGAALVLVGAGAFVVARRRTS